MAELIIDLGGGAVHRHEIRGVTLLVGSGEGVGLRIDAGGIAPRHALIYLHDGGWFISDEGSADGTFAGQKRVPREGSPLGYKTRLRFGTVSATFRRSVTLAQELDYWRGWLHGSSRRMAGFWISVAFHLVLLIFFAKVVFYEVTTPPPDLVADSGFVVADTSGQNHPPGGDASAAAPAFSAVQAATGLSQTAISTADIVAITSAAAASFSLPSTGGGMPSAPPRTGISGTGGSGTSKFGKGSKLGSGVGDWVGGGEGGIGITGRGKTLRTLREFSCYFVIHSGDWYAALDWREAPEVRQKEISYPGLPDEKNISWYEETPVPGQGPFLAYYWGTFSVNRKKVDSRDGCLEFTPGAVSNILRFVRQASADAIKGSSKPHAVVLDRALIPYDYNPALDQMTWMPENRERLRETLRAALPPGNKYEHHGYLWNPRPADKASTDFTVEYLLDVKPMPPFVYFTGNDDFTLSEAEVETLTQYLLRGGAIWGDSGFAGNRSKFDTAFRREMKRVVPDVDKPFRPLPVDRNIFTTGLDAYFELPQLPQGMQFYQSPVEIIELRPGLVSIVLTKNAYGNLLRFDLAYVDNKFQIGGDTGRGDWAKRMWQFRSKFFRNIDSGSVMSSYQLAGNILVYMLGRWPTVLKNGGLNE